jgi:hypothetical protein
MTVRRLTSLAAVLLAAGLVSGQGAPKKDAPAKGPPKPAPGSLEDTLEKALRNSAEIRSAEVKVREAEAELNRVRQQVLTRATAIYSDLKLARRMLAVAEQNLTVAQARIARVGKDESTPTETIEAYTQALLAAEAGLEKHRGEVEKLETELKSMRGQFAIKDLPIVSAAFDPFGRVLAAEGADGRVRVWDVTEEGTALSPFLADQYLALTGTAKLTPPAVSGSMLDRVKKVLDQEVEFEVGGMTMENALRDLVAATKSDIPIRAILNAVQADARVELRSAKLPIGAWIQALEDSDDQVVVVVRDYGLLLTMKNRIPPGALRVHDLWKGNYVELKKSEKK